MLRSHSPGLVRRRQSIRDKSVHVPSPLGREDGTHPPFTACPGTIHEEMIQQLRRLGFQHFTFTIFLALPGAALAGFAAIGEGELTNLVAGLMLLSVLVQLYLAYSQLHTTDPDRITDKVREQPPELIPVDTTQPPLLQVR